MKRRKLSKSILKTIVFLLIASCGPVVITSRGNNPLPPWFYPNRLEVVRYVYFPEFSIYYDLYARAYIFLEGGIWLRRNDLPSRYNNANLMHSGYERIQNYSDDNISRYHEENNTNRGRSNRTVRRNNE
ncbi:hypothetical protein F0361_09550 [Maribacter flavus]|uniref:Uncharacterized protein n=1 Tax=Maribacter flavus TaxID=1658664 RepID=A0A5B2TZS5_9FLAO|nr:hypothetical protein F0361_09550 [Maribacter flavus]